MIAIRPNPAVQVVATALALGWGLFPPSAAPGWPGRVREALRDDPEGDRIEHGYYENLVAPAPDGGATKRRKVAFEDTPLVERVADVRELALKPGLATVHWGVRWSSNDRGMRDRPVAPAGTTRVALLGDSIAAGWGVDDGEHFEPILEREWDARSRRAGGPGVDVLNFAVPGHAPGQRWANYLAIGAGTRPDLLIYEATLADLGWDERRLRVLLPKDIGWDFEPYRAALEASGARPGGDAEAFRRALRPHREALLAGVYGAIAAGCRAEGIPAAWVLVPRVGRHDDPKARRRLVELAQAAGFDPVVDASDAYEGSDPAALAVNPGDYHPNAEGHARLARAVDRGLASAGWVARAVAEGGGRR